MKPALGGSWVYAPHVRVQLAVASVGGGDGAGTGAGAGGGGTVVDATLTRSTRQVRSLDIYIWQGV